MKTAQTNQNGTEKYRYCFDFPVFSADLPPDAPLFFLKAYWDPCVVALNWFSSVVVFFFFPLSLKERQTWKALNLRCIIIQEML